MLNIMFNCILAFVLLRHIIIYTFIHNVDLLDHIIDLYISYIKNFHYLQYLYSRGVYLFEGIYFICMRVSN